VPDGAIDEPHRAAVVDAASYPIHGRVVTDHAVPEG
jgi:hypothetical protein